MNFFDLDKLNKPVLTRSLIFLIIVVYSLWLFKQYAGNHHSVYLHMYKYTQGIFSFEYDIFLKRTNQEQVSILYTIFAFLKINPDNDYVGFLLHIIFSTIAGYCLFRFIRDFTPIKETNGALVAIFALLTIGGSLIQATRSSWVVNHTAHTSYFAHCLIFLFILLLVRRSTFWLFFLSTLILLISARASWFVVGIGIIYSIVFSKNLRENLWIIGPLLALIYLASLEVMPLSDYDTRKLIFNNVLNRDRAEVAFHLQSNKHLIFLILSFPISLLMILKLKNSEFKNLSFVILTLSFLCFIFGYFYALHGEKIWPEPRLLALSPTRALATYQLFFWILLISWIYKSKFYSIIKAGLLSSIFYALTGLKGFIISIFIIIIIFFTIKLFKYKNIFNLKGLVLDSSLRFNNFVTLLFFLLILPGITYLSFKSLRDFDYYALQKINKWTVGPLSNDHRRLSNAIDLQKCDDFIFLDLEYATWTSAISGKSQFLGDPFFNHFDLELLKIAESREKIARSIKNNISQMKKINEEDIKFLYNLGVVIILNVKDLEFFPKNIAKVNLKNDDVLLLFFDEPRTNAFLKNCKKKLLNT